MIGYESGSIPAQELLQKKLLLDDVLRVSNHVLLIESLGYSASRHLGTFPAQDDCITFLNAINVENFEARCKHQVNLLVRFQLFAQW